MPRLLVLASTYPRWAGDPEPGFVHTLNRYLTASFEVHVICPHAPGASDEDCLDGVQIHRFRYAPVAWEQLVQGGGILNNLKHQPWKWLLVPGFFIGQGLWVWRLLRHLRPAILQAHWIIPQGLVLAPWLLVSRKRPAILLTAHGGDLFGLRGPVFRTLQGWIARRVEAVTVVSRPMAEVARGLGVCPARLRVIPMGVAFDDGFTLPPAGYERRRDEILFVGRLVEKKGLRHLIAALPAIIARAPRARLTVAGFGPEAPALRALVERLGVGKRVTWLGPVPHAKLPALYQRAAVCVMPFIEATSGDREGLPLVTVEAIACGCPVVVGDLAVLDDIFLASEADFRVDPRQADVLANRIVAILRHHPAALLRTQRIRERLQARFCWSRVAGDYAAVLHGLISINLVEGGR